MNEREVIIIPATKQNLVDYKKRQLKVASYCRVSTDSEEQLNSFESQKTYYTNYIHANKNWKFVKCYADEGISGASAKKRPDFMKMIHHCMQGKIDLIITKSISRFSRNILDSISFIRKLKAQNIGVYFEKENLNSLEESSELIFTILAGIAQEELISLSKNVKLGKRMAIKEGKVHIQYKHLYGYEKGNDNKPKIIEEQAEVVKRIFTKYLMGKSTIEIANELNQDNISAPKGGKWKTGTIRNIIKNEVYSGDVILQKTYISDPISKRVIVNNGELPKVHIMNNHQAIISRGMFKITQLERSKRSKKSKVEYDNTISLKKYSGKHALNGMLICKCCKSDYRRAVWTKRDSTRQAVWRCSSRLDHGTKYCTESISIDEISLQQAIIDSINSTKKDRRKMIDILTDELGQSMRDMSNLEKVNVLEIQSQIAQLKAETMKIITDPQNKDKMSMLAEELKQKSDEIKRLNEIIEHHNSQKINVEINQTIADVRTTIEEKELVTKWDNALIRQLINVIEVIDESKIRIIYSNGFEDVQGMNLQVRRLCRVESLKKIFVRSNKMKFD